MQHEQREADQLPPQLQANHQVAFASSARVRADQPQASRKRRGKVQSVPDSRKLSAQNADDQAGVGSVAGQRVRQQQRRQLQQDVGIEVQRPAAAFLQRVDPRAAVLSPKRTFLHGFGDDDQLQLLGGADFHRQHEVVRRLHDHKLRGNERKDLFGEPVHMRNGVLLHDRPQHHVGFDRSDQRQRNHSQAATKSQRGNHGKRKGEVDAEHRELDEKHRVQRASARQDEQQDERSAHGEEKEHFSHQTDHFRAS